MCSWVGDVRLAERAYYVNNRKIFHNCQSQGAFLPPKPFREKVQISESFPMYLLNHRLCVCDTLVNDETTANAISVPCECG